WALMSPSPTMCPSASIATWPATKTSAPAATSTPAEYIPMGLPSPGGVSTRPAMTAPFIPSGSAASSLRRNRRDRADLDQELRTRQRLDDDERLGGRGLAEVLLGDAPGRLHETRVGGVDRHLDDVAQVPARLADEGPHVLDRLARLGRGGAHPHVPPARPVAVVRTLTCQATVTRRARGPL